MILAIYWSFTLQNQCCHFWEAFPARDGRTTYLFTYGCSPRSPRFGGSIRGLSTADARISGREITQLQLQGALFGFPSYRQSPLRHHGAAFCQSEIAAATNPLELWGFGAMVRHLKRLTVGIHEALKLTRFPHKLWHSTLSTKPDRYLAVSGDERWY